MVSYNFFCFTQFFFLAINLTCKQNENKNNDVDDAYINVFYCSLEVKATGVGVVISVGVDIQSCMSGTAESQNHNQMISLHLKYIYISARKIQH